MWISRAHRKLAWVASVAVCLALPAGLPAATSLVLSGVIAGTVSDNAGVPQMGATVQVFNRQDRPFAKMVTDERGEFAFMGLMPDVYSVRVTLAAFVPALKKDILVQPGMRSVLNVNLNTLFSTIQLTYPPFENGGLMTDDWKWVLRSAASTRPVLRLTPSSVPDKEKEGRHEAVFSDTRGLVQLSAGEGIQAPGAASQADMGTAFALATSLFGTNTLEVSGNLGYGAQTGVPVAAFRTSYRRAMGMGNPEFSVTMRQMFLPGRIGGAFAGPGSAELRSVAAGYDDETRLSENLTLKYGMTVESVSLVDRRANLSPYARLSYMLGQDSEVDFTYTSGNARPDLGNSGMDGADLERSLSSLGLFPRFSMRDGRPRIQRGEEFELAYKYKTGSRTYMISAYRETIANAALSLVAPDSFYGGDVVPDLFSDSATFNAGDFESTGYLLAVTQALGQDVSATLMYGSMGALTADSREMVSDNPDELRSMIHAGRKHAATVQVAAISPWTGTKVDASYQFSGDQRWAMPGNVYSTQAIRPIPGLNLCVRQPIPDCSTAWKLPRSCATSWRRAT